MAEVMAAVMAAVTAEAGDRGRRESEKRVERDPFAGTEEAWTLRRKPWKLTSALEEAAAGAAGAAVVQNVAAEVMAVEISAAAGVV